MNANPPILSELGNAALSYAARGWPVFPLKPHEKLPLISKSMGGKGHLNATTDPLQIRRWWTATPNANIGLHLAAAGLVAIDPDTYKPDCEWHDFIRGRDLPDTLVQTSARGGKHYIFTAGSDERFPDTVCRQVDIKHNGYIVVAPSTFEGGSYSFDTDDAPAPCPQWVPRKGAADIVRLTIATNTDRFKGIEDYQRLITGASTDGDKHTATRDLAASLAGQGVSETFATGLIQAVCPVWDNNLQNSITSAYAKYSSPPIERSSSFYSAATLKGKAVPPREWLVNGLVPKNTVTLFSGDGGTGKSLVALQLAVGVASETAWLGKAVEHGRVIYISAEDDDDELHRRIADITRASGIAYDALGGLTLRSLAGEDALLAVESGMALMQSELFKELDQRAADETPALIVVDTLADVYPANENDRAKVRQFIGILRGLALKRNCAVLLLGHPSLTGLSSGTGTSGSTAWNNSVRSRLYLSRITDGGFEADPDKRVMTTMKANYGRIGGETHMKWQAGVFVAKEAAQGLDAMAAGAKAQRVFLKLLAIYTAQGRQVNHAGGSRYAPKLFAEHPDNEGMTKRALKAAMEGLLAAEKIVILREGPASRRVTYIAEAGQ